MVSARWMCVVASAFAVHLAACSGGSDGTSPTSSHPPPGGSAQSGTPKADGGGGPTPVADAGGAPDDDGGQGATSPCAPYIGRWIATLDPGATATGSDTAIVGGSVALSGTIDFTFTHDDADLPDILDFTGTAKIVAAGQTITQAIEPATSPSGDPKDSSCAGGMHFIGQANVSGIGKVLFTIVGTLDTTVTPTVGTGSFTMMTADDDGGALSGGGNVHMVHQ